MIVVTGGEGFIGQNLVERLRRDYEISVVSLDTKSSSLEYIYNWLSMNVREIDGIYHIGAISDTTEMDTLKFDIYNVNMSTFIWDLCSDFRIPLVYASSAATYGDGALGFDDEQDLNMLHPLNPYGWSKQTVDEKVTFQANKELFSPPFWAGLKFFNVYGYGESHKGRMASMVYHTFNQISESGGVKLFKSHRPDYDHGEQVRDFIYVDDIVDVCIWMLETYIQNHNFKGTPPAPPSGIYNVGTGKARSFNDLVRSVFKSLNDTPVDIEYIDTPEDIREQYQYYTQATTKKLRDAGYEKPFTELETGVDLYIKQLSL